jgi:hypothetical protein
VVNWLSGPTGLETTLLKVLNNLADIKSAGLLRFASEIRGSSPFHPFKA